MAKIRADLVFSYWIFGWYILFALNVTSYSPKFALILGALDNMFMLAMMLLYGTSTKTIFYFILINIAIKIVPLYYLINIPIKTSDIYFTCGLFTLFIIWLRINNQQLIGNAKLIYDSIVYNKNDTPLFSFLAQMQQNYKQMQII